MDRSDAKSRDDALQNTPAVIIATAHQMFKELSPKDFLNYGVKVIIDGRNCLPKEEFVESGIIYKGIGSITPDFKEPFCQTVDGFLLPDQFWEGS